MTDLHSSSARGAAEQVGIHRRRSSAGGVVLRVVGEVDAHTAPLLLEAARHELAAGSALVFDLAGVSFCSARCIGTLVEIRRLAQGYGATVRITRPSDTVRRIADLVHARDVIDGSAPRPGRCTSRRGRTGRR